ncbi:MAG: glycosyltransferase family 8 protein [Clostridia bacterium]|nr:glycosyltransferase family 8 protein [Clostridia bacterium]
MNILVTLDRNYLQPLSVMLCSLLLCHPGEAFDVFVISSDLTREDMAEIDGLCACFGARLHLVAVDETCFEHAPTLRYYSRAMYYRLLAAQLLPKHLERILYLDPDVLVIGSLRALYDMDMGDMLYAAAMHEGLINLSGPVNQIRLQNFDTKAYYNSGVLLMNLPAIRESVHGEDIFAYVKENRNILILPDQDVLNGLYGARILALDETLYNYDARKYNEYLIASQGERDMKWVMGNTAILHFCGKTKPWKKNCRTRFTSLYRHYMRLTQIYMRGTRQTILCERGNECG